MTDAELQGIAAQALNMAKKDFAAGNFSCLLGTCDQGQSLHRMQQIEAMLVEKLGKMWLNSGPAKDAAFGLLKLGVQALGPDAFVFVSVANAFVPTEAMNRLSEKERQAIVNAGHDRHHQAVKEGLLMMRDIMSALVQTSERVCVCAELLGSEEPPRVEFFDQSRFAGRLKMYGSEAGEPQWKDIGKIGD